MASIKTRFSLLGRLLLVWALCLVAALPAAAYTVIIDAGHGGKDHGAIDNGVREKDINLGVALQVAKLLKKHKNIKVILTRDKDEYLTLQQRADIANKAKGDLFISIHTNSVAESNPNRATVAGASTYTLGTHKDGANMEVARRENNVMTFESDYSSKYAGFDPNSDESYIIFEMAQKSNMAQSVKFANSVQQQLHKVAGRKDRGVHQAGFWVLWATSMPAALIELDFICNPNSAKYISSQTGQKKLAEAIANSTVDYFNILAKHEKERLRTENRQPEQAEPTFDAGEGVVLASVEPEQQKMTDAPEGNVPRERTRRPATRRRRSDSSRQKSQSREYEVAVIPDQVQYVAEAETVVEEEPVVAAPEPAPAKDKKGKKADKQKKQKQQKQQKAAPQKAGSQAVAANKPAKPGKTAGQGGAKPAKSQQVAAATPAPKGSQAKPAKQKPKSEPAPKAQKPARTKADKGSNRQASTSPVRLAKVNTVYKIEIYSCDKILKEKDPLFGGLYPVTCSRSGDNKYTYYYGESTSQGEIYRMLSDVQKVFPEARVVKARRQ